MPPIHFQQENLRKMNHAHMHQLATGRYAEEILKQFAARCTVEDHPVWLLVMDADNEEYKAYFSEGELA